jgi:hypothetical protein
VLLQALVQARDNWFIPKFNNMNSGVPDMPTALPPTRSGYLHLRVT